MNLKDHLNVVLAAALIGAAAAASQWMVEDAQREAGNRAAAEIRGLIAVVDQKETYIDLLEGRIRADESAIRMLTRERDDARRAIIAFKADLAELRKTLAQLVQTHSEQVTGLRRSLLAETALRDEAESQVRDLQERLAVAEAQADAETSAQRAEAQSVRAELKNARAQIEDLKIRLEEARASAAAANRRVAEIVSQIAEASKEMEEMRRSTFEATSREAELEKRVSLISAESAALVKQIEEIRAASEARDAASSARAAQLLDQAAVLRVENERLKAAAVEQARLEWWDVILQLHRSIKSQRDEIQSLYRRIAGRK